MKEKSKIMVNKLLLATLLCPKIPFEKLQGHNLENEYIEMECNGIELAESEDKNDERKFH